MSLNSMRNAFRFAGIGKWLLGIVTVAMLVTAFTGIGSMLRGVGGPEAAESAAQAANDPSSVVATVNGQPITRGEYLNAYQQQQADAAASGKAPSGVMGALKYDEGALQQTILYQLKLQVARQAGVTATPAQIDAARSADLTGLKSELGLAPSASDDEVNQALQKYHRTMSTVLPSDNQLRDGVILQNYQNGAARGPLPSDADVQAYYREVHARHILIGNKTRPDAQAKQQAEQIIAKLKSGGDFAALAKQYSDDPGTKFRGGDDNFISAQTPYAPGFLKAALNLQPGQVTPEPVLVPQFGYFVIQALASRENLPKDYAKNKAKYQQLVAQQQQQAAANAALSSALQTAKIDVTDPYLHAWYLLSQPGGLANGKAVLADLQKALPTADFSRKGQIYALMALIDGQSGDTKAQIAALNSALQQTEDPVLRMLLGDAYRKDGNAADAVKQYKIASDNAYDDPRVHATLRGDYTQLHRPELAAAETKWLNDYQARTALAALPPPTSAARPVGTPTTTTALSTPASSAAAPPALGTAGLDGNAPPASSADLTGSAAGSNPLAGDAPGLPAGNAMPTTPAGR